ncbi:MAG TPA: FecR family protein, partial [Bacteroidales bacterium]|nr:FecR family protein [Bacteroidales bacterium]
MHQETSIPEDVSLLITDFFKGVIDDEGLKKLKEWLNESDAHLKQFNSLKSVWLMSGNSVSFTSEKIDAELEKTKEVLKKREPKVLLPFWTFSKVAASWLLFLVMGGILGSLLFENHNISSKGLITVISSPLGSKSIVDLPDGTKVWINAGSRISYDHNYGKTHREVSLTGEAYFNVKTNKQVPFIVKTSDIMVKALGTKFNVKAYPNERTITATLEEGKIFVSSVNAKSKLKDTELKPKQMFTYVRSKKEEKVRRPVYEQPKEVIQSESISDNARVYSEVKTELLTSWKDDTWIIEGQPLGLLAPILERRYNVVINF